MQPLVNLIKPDWENWKPLKESNRKRMRIVHGFEPPEPAKEGFSNLVS
jgi:hypothetical protein